MKILITGGAGFIGKQTALALIKQGHSVRIVDNLDPQIHGYPALTPILPENAELIQGDIRDLKLMKHAVQGTEAIFHFAAQTGVGQSMMDLDTYVDTNVRGTATLIEAVLKTKTPIQKWILSSSRAVYGEGPCQCDQCGVVFPEARSLSSLEKGRFEPECPRCRRALSPLPTQETHPLNPVSLYGWTKKAQEELLRQSMERLGQSLIILRYFNVYGPGQSLLNPYTGILPIFYSRVRARKPISMYENGKPVRDFVHIADVVQANLLALTASVPPGSTFNIGSGEPITIANLIEVIGKACGAPALITNQGEFRLGDIFSAVAELTHSCNLLGYRPSILLLEGLKSFFSWADIQTYQDTYEQSVNALKTHGLFRKVA